MGVAPANADKRGFARSDWRRSCIAQPTNGVGSAPNERSERQGPGNGLHANAQEAKLPALQLVPALPRAMDRGLDGPGGPEYLPVLRGARARLRWPYTVRRSRRGNSTGKGGLRVAAARYVPCPRAACPGSHPSRGELARSRASASYASRPSARQPPTALPRCDERQPPHSCGRLRPVGRAHGSRAELLFPSLLAHLLAGPRPAYPRRPAQGDSRDVAGDPALTALPLRPADRLTQNALRLERLAA